MHIIHGGGLTINPQSLSYTNNEVLQYLTVLDRGGNVHIIHVGGLTINSQSFSYTSVR